MAPTHPSNHADTNPCPHNRFRLHWGHSDGLGHGYSLPWDRMSLSMTNAAIIIISPFGIPSWVPGFRAAELGKAHRPPSNKNGLFFEAHLIRQPLLSCQSIMSNLPPFPALYFEFLQRQPGSTIVTFGRKLPAQFARWSIFSEKMVVLLLPQLNRRQR